MKTDRYKEEKQKASGEFYFNYGILQIIIKELNLRAKQNPTTPMREILETSPYSIKYKERITFEKREFLPNNTIEYR